jgi:CheY-like chemotaxis protein
MSARVLVVEDNAANLDLIDCLLRAFGYAPLLADNGREAVGIAARTRPDIVLLDLWMPDMDGYAVAREIRAHPGLERVRLVAVTASAMVGDRARIAGAGFDGYIQKPIDPETFIASFERFLPSTSGALNTIGGR